MQISPEVIFLFFLFGKGTEGTQKVEVCPEQVVELVGFSIGFLVTICDPQCHCKSFTRTGSMGAWYVIIDLR